MISILSLAGFLAVAVLGFAVMSHTMEHGGCVASVAQGVDCPLALGTIGFLALHTGFYQTLTSAVFAVLALAFVLFAFSPVVPLASVGSTRPARYRHDSRLARPRDISRWFARLQTSPNPA